MEIYPFKALYPKLDLISSADSFFGSVKRDFREFYQSGFFQQQKQDALYICQIESPLRQYRGVIGCIDISAYLNGRVRKHELTLADKMQKQVSLAIHRKAAVKPVLLTYPGFQQIEAWTDRYLDDGPEPFLRVGFPEEQLTHTFWQVSDPPAITQLQALFRRDLEVAYIADGHHRSAAIGFMSQRGFDKDIKPTINRLFCAFFPPDQLDILDYNRVVSLDADFSPIRFMARLSALCSIEVLDSPRKPAHKHEMLMGIGEEWYMLRWKEQVLAHEDILWPDTQLLNELILQDILGMEDVQTDQRIAYVEGPKGLAGLIKKLRASENTIAFGLHPVSAEMMFRLADRGITLPPKSTWFEPRMKNGLLVHPFASVERSND